MTTGAIMAGALQSPRRTPNELEAKQADPAPISKPRSDRGIPVDLRQSQMPLGIGFLGEVIKLVSITTC